MSLKIGVIGTPPGVMDCALSDICPNRGFAFDTAVQVCQTLGYNCTFEWYESKEYGNADESGNGTGLVGAIQHSQYDTSVPVFTPTYARFHAITFSDIYFDFDVLFTTRRPTRHRHVLNLGVIYSFQWQTWCVFILSLIFTALVFTLAAYCVSSPPKLKSKKAFKILIDTCAALVSLRGSGKNTTFSLLDKSAVLLFWTLTSIVLTSAYTGMLFSQKVTSDTNLPFIDFSSLVECLESGACRLLTHSTSISAFQLLTAPGNDLSDRVNRVIKHNPVIVAPLELIPQMILHEARNYLVWVWSQSAILYAIGGNENCSFYMVQAPYKEVYTFPLRKNSSILNGLNDVSASFMEHGLAYAIRARYPGTAVCETQWGTSRPNKDTLDDESTLGAVMTIFLFYALGIGTAIVTCAGEVWMRKRRRQE